MENNFEENKRNDMIYNQSQHLEENSREELNSEEIKEYS
jgi:hypothetical protein